MEAFFGGKNRKTEKIIGFVLLVLEKSKDKAKRFANQLLSDVINCFFLRAELNGYHHQSKSYIGLW